MFSGLLTYEVEVAFSTQAMSEEADHLMQLYAAVDDGCHGNQGAHVGVHLLVHQPEGQTLIPNQSLERCIVFYDPQQDNPHSFDTKKWDLEENRLPDHDFLHRLCISLHSACWSVCGRYCPCPSPHPLTPSGSTQ